MLRSATIAAALIASFAAVAPASAFTKVKVTKVDDFGNRASVTRVSGTNAFGEQVRKTRVVIDPAGPGNKIVATRITRADGFGGTVSVTKVRRAGF